MLTSITHKAFLICCIFLFFFLAIRSVVNDSLTMDEPNHITRGITFWKTGDPRLSVEHPPLINALSTIIAWRSDELELPMDHPSWNRNTEYFWYDFADALFWESGINDISQIVFLSRVPIICMTIFLALIGGLFSFQLWGNRLSGIVAFVSILFNPNIIAHGRYSTTDIGGTLSVLVIFWLIHRFANDKNHLKTIAVLAIAIGLGLASKLTVVAFLPIFAVYFLLNQDAEQNKTFKLICFFLACCGALFVVWSIYLFEFGQYEFISNNLKVGNQFSGPMPSFFAGIERIAFATGGGRDAYLMGKHSTNGFLFYFPIAFLVKTPISHLLLVVIGAYMLAINIQTRFTVVKNLVPIILYFVLVMLTGLNIGYRHLLPILPLLYVCVSGLVAIPVRHEGFLVSNNLIWSVGLIALILPAVFSFPHYISYFNLFTVQKEKWEVLGDSNIDWGQDLIRLDDWLSENRIDEYKLSYFGSSPPSYILGKPYEALPGDKINRDLWWDVPFNENSPENGVYVISIHNLLEMPLRTNKTVYHWFRDREPDATVGSFNIYIVDN